MKMENPKELNQKKNAHLQAQVFEISMKRKQAQLLKFLAILGVLPRAFLGLTSTYLLCT